MTPEWSVEVRSAKERRGGRLCKGPDIAQHLARQTNIKEMSCGCSPGHEKEESRGESYNIVD